MRANTESLEQQLRGPHCAETCGHKTRTNNECNDNDLRLNSTENNNDMLPHYDDFIKLIHEIDEIEEIVPNLYDNIENDQINANTTETNDISSKYIIENNNDSGFDDGNIDVLVQERLNDIVLENVQIKELEYEKPNTDSAIYSNEEILRAIDSIVQIENEENNIEKTSANNNIEYHQINANTETKDISSKYNIENNNDTESDDVNIDALIQEIFNENVQHSKLEYEKSNTDSVIYSDEQISRAIDSIVQIENEENAFEQTPNNDGFVERIGTDFGKTSGINGRLDDSIETSYEAPDTSLININTNESKKLNFKKALVEKYKKEELQKAPVVEIEIIKIPANNIDYQCLSEFLNFDRSNGSSNENNVQKDRTKKLKTKLRKSVEDKYNINNNNNVVKEENRNSEKTLEKGDNVTKKNKTVKRKETIYECDLCERQFKYKKGLNEHIVSNHGPKTIKCPECDYTTTKLYKLRIHTRGHLVERPYRCNLCDYTCMRKDVMQTHHFKHTGEKPYKCHYCNSRFRCLKYLNRHIKLHCSALKY